MSESVLKTKQKGKRGNPNIPPGPGRPKGMPNKFTNLKQAFLDAFKKMGGVEALYEWAKTNQHTKAQFYQMLSKMLPSDVNMGGELNIRATLSIKDFTDSLKKLEEKKSGA